MHDLTKGNEARTLFLFTLPMLAGSVLQQLYSMADGIIVGRAVGKEALAAVGISFPVVFLLVSLVIGLTMGFSVLVGQFHGARRPERVAAVIDTAMLVLFLAALFFSLIGLFAGRAILSLLETPVEVLETAHDYLQITFAGMVFLFGYGALGAVMRGLGDSRTPLVLLVISNLINIGLDLLFVLGFGWGVAGAAWATVIAQGVACLFGFAWLARMRRRLGLEPWRLRVDRAALKNGVSIGLPSAIQQSLVALGFLALSRIVNGFGAITAAGYAAAMRIDNFAMMPVMNLSMALTSFTAQNLGAGFDGRAARGLRATLLGSGAISLGVAAVVILFGRELVGLFNPDNDVIAIGADYLLFVGSGYVLFAMLFAFNGLLRGAGDTFVPMLVTFVALWFVRIPLAVLFSGKLGTTGIWLSIPTGWLVGALLAWLWYRRGSWRSRVVAGPAACVVPESAGE